MSDWGGWSEWIRKYLQIFAQILFISNHVSNVAFIIQLKDFNQSEKNEATTEEVERVYDILKRTYREQNSKFTGRAQEILGWAM